MRAIWGSPCSVSGRTPIVFTDGVVNESRTIYQSTSVDGELLHFPEGRTYDFVHGLGSRPIGFDVYLSFRERLDPDGDPSDETEPNNLSLAAGNQAVIEEWNDEIIRVRNDTCAEVYIRFVAYADPDAASEFIGTAGAPAD
jgi:hypothetical protein